MFWSGGRGLARAPQVREHALASTFFAPQRREQEASRPVQDPDLDSLRLCSPLQENHWLGLVRQFFMTSGSTTRWIRAWHSFPERELLPFRPLLQHRRLDGKPPVQGLVQAPVQVSTVLTILGPPQASGGQDWAEARHRTPLQVPEPIAQSKGHSTPARTPRTSER